MTRQPTPPDLLTDPPEVSGLELHSTCRLRTHVVMWVLESFRVDTFCSGEDFRVVQTVKKSLTLIWRAWGSLPPSLKTSPLPQPLASTFGPSGLRLQPFELCPGCCNFAHLGILQCLQVCAPVRDSDLPCSKRSESISVKTRGVRLTVKRTDQTDGNTQISAPASSISSSSSTNFIVTQVLKQNFMAAMCHDVLHYSCNVNAAVADSLHCRMICGIIGHKFNFNFMVMQ